MIIDYEIIKIADENILVLKLNYSYEFGSFNKIKNEDILTQVKHYLKNIHLDNYYNKILLTVSGVVVANLLYINGNYRFVHNIKTELPINDVVSSGKDTVIAEQENIESNQQDNIVEKVEDDSNLSTGVVENLDENVEKQSSKKYKQSFTVEKYKETVIKEENTVEIDDDEKIISDQTKEEESFPQNKLIMVNVYRSNGKIEEIELEDYVVGVVAGEMPASFNKEALKSQAIVARTYALRKINLGEKITDNVSTQTYIDIEDMQKKWGNDFSKYYNKIKECVNETNGQYIVYNNEIINAVYHSTSNGYTEDAINVWNDDYPYLKSVDSHWDKNVSSYEKVFTKDLKSIINLMGIINVDDFKIDIIEVNESGRVEKVLIGNQVYTGIEIRNMLGLRSTDFNISINDDIVKITTRGYGHGVGMSQYGANEMAKEGYTAIEIIKHYYTGVEITK